VSLVASKKPKGKGKSGKNGSYIDSGSGSFESMKRERLDNLGNIELEKHWEDIFGLPESEREFRESDFREPGVSKLLTGTFSNRLKILKEAIEEIEREIDERIELGISFRERIDSEVSKCRDFLKRLEDYTIGYNSTIELRRLAFERMIFTLTKELRSEDLRAWEDIISLMKERRNLVIEYKNLMNTRKMFSKEEEI
jgi:hypothetical protein